jgi:hypothetical protein
MARVRGRPNRAEAVTSDPFEIVDPGDAGREWLHERLRDGKTLCRLVFDRLARTVQVETLVPRGFSPQRFDHGIAEPLGLEAARPWFLDRLAAVAASGTLVVAEDRIALRGDKGLERARARCAFYGDEVYVVAEGGASRDEFDVLVSEAQSALCLVVFVGAPEPGFAPGHDPSLDDLTRFARSVRWIGVDAYDGDTYMVARVDVPVSEE